MKQMEEPRNQFSSLKQSWNNIQEERVIKTHLDENINAFIPFQNMMLMHLHENYMEKLKTTWIEKLNK